MQVLLINQNATIERLVKLSSGKLGYELINAKDISEVENGAYGFIIIDSDLYNEEEFGVLKQKFNGAKYILIITKGADRPDGFDIYIEKPFLPTELVDIFSSLASSVPNTEEEDIFGGEDLPLAENEESDFSSFDEDAVFGTDEQEDISNGEEPEMLSGLDDIGTLELDDEKHVEPATDELEDLEFSFDEAENTEDKENEELDLNTLSEDTDAGDDDFQINLDEHLDAIGSEMDDINFDAQEDVISDGLNEEALGLDSIESNDDFGSLDELGASDASTLDEIALEENHDDINEVALEDSDFGDFSLDEDDISLDETTSAETDPHIFDEDEVNKLKDLLDETEEDKSEGDDFDLENIKIHNEELGSLTEESLAEALGVNIDDSTQSLSDEPSELDSDDDIMSNNALPDSLTTVSDISTAAATNIPANAIQLNPNQSITISLDALKELLNMADVTINITLSKKQ